MPLAGQCENPEGGESLLLAAARRTVREQSEKAQFEPATYEHATAS